MDTSKTFDLHPKLYWASWFLVLSTFLLLIAGGLVTSHEAGLAVPDWPLSYGQFFPPMVGNIFWEHGHRMIAGFVGLSTLVFVLAVQFIEKRIWIKKFAWLLLLAVALQAILGGLTVLWLLPSWVSIFHACLGQTFFCLAIAMAYFLNPGFPLTLPAKEGFNSRERFETVPCSLRRLAALTTVLIYAQLILGAYVRHTGGGVVFHILMAFTILFYMVTLVVRSLREMTTLTAVFRVVVFLGTLTVVQIFLGMGSFIFTHMFGQGYAPSLVQVVFTSSHQSTGALILGLSLWLTLRLQR